MISDELLPLRSDPSKVDGIYPSTPISRRVHILKSQYIGRFIDYFPFLFLMFVSGVLWFIQPFENLSLYVKLGISFIILGVFTWWIYIVYIKSTKFKINSHYIETGTLKTPLKIALMTDLHLGDKRYGASIKKITKAVDVINKYKPDMFIVSGDLVDEDFNDLSKDTLKVLEGINATIKLGVYGNHDAFHTKTRGLKENPKDLIKHIEKETKIKFLFNKAKEFEIKNNKILIGGVPDLGGRLVNIDKTFEEFDKSEYDYVMLLSHNPDVIDFLHESDNIDLILSGHNHAGQIALPIVGPILPMPTKHKHHLKGVYEVGGKTKLFLSQGFAHAATRVRVGTDCEINLITLTK